MKLTTKMCIKKEFMKLFTFSLLRKSLLIMFFGVAGAVILKSPVNSQLTQKKTPRFEIFSSNLRPSGQPKLGVGWEISNVSGDAEILLARHLNKIGAKTYVAWWCPHCHEQKQLFGKKAYNLLKHIECDPRGQNPRPDLCKAAKVQGFPTWQIEDKLYAGVHSLEELATISGYKGSKKFKYHLSKKEY
jgi:hypothetical protein